MATRRMITLRDESWLFQYRAAAILVRDGCVLLCRDNSNRLWYVPGGRVELGESSDALVREMSEELKVSVQIERLVWVVETFWASIPIRCTRLSRLPGVDSRKHGAIDHGRIHDRGIRRAEKYFPMVAVRGAGWCASLSFVPAHRAARPADWCAARHSSRRRRLGISPRFVAEQHPHPRVTAIAKRSNRRAASPSPGGRGYQQKSRSVSVLKNKQSAAHPFWKTLSLRERATRRDGCFFLQPS